MENEYAKRSKISEAKFRQLVKHFVIDLTATDSAELCSLNLNTVNRFYNAFRERIAEYCAQISPIVGEVEIDESYFEPRRVRDKRGRGAGNKTIVFGLFKRDGKVYTEIVPDCKAMTLQAIIRGRVDMRLLSIPMAGEAMMVWLTLVMKSITA